MALGETTSCTLTDQGVECWGSNQYAQYGNRDLTGSGSPQIGIPAGDANLTGLSAGGQRLFCGMNNQSWTCWGQFDEESNGFDAQGNPGQFGGYTQEPMTNPAGNPTLHLIATDQYGACIVYGEDANNKSVGCAGVNRFGLIDVSGQRNDNQFTNWVETHRDVGDITSLALHSGTGCLIANGELKCWGNGEAFRTGSINLTTYFGTNLE